MKILSIIICTYNRESLLLKCLQELIRQITEIGDSPFDIVIVDNNCSDGTNKLVSDLAKQHSWLRVVKEIKQGLSHARNCGANVALGTYLCYLDDDGYPASQYLINTLRIIDEQRPDIFGGPIYPFYTTKKPFWFQDSLEIRRHADVTGFADCAISGGNYIIRSELLRQLGMFSPDYGMVGTRLRLGEDRELLERYKRVTPPADHRIYYSLECFIYHHVPSYKMSLAYFAKRAYQSGKMSILIRTDTKTAPVVTLKSMKRVVARLSMQLISGGSDTHFLLRTLHCIAMISGIAMQNLKDIAGKKKH